ncbi:MAG TPA: polyhydroxyalkanoate synthesis regulator DNA-binding domain-containing protein [Candidatus Dormibacteraeota bacterium]|nr:polyhydroxyalkanoate synthesis regulator DNA-binding domain-containing protein [Candidatus Dormibacteraeota bacterium]
METHVVKKYSNRKLYDTFTRRYVTLDVIAELLRRGDEVRVVDRNTGEDITAVTLSQILLDMERQRRSPIPEPLLVDLVKERGEQLISMLRASFALPREIRSRAAGGLERSAQTLENRVDDVLTTGLHNLNIATQEEVEALQRRVDELTRRLDALDETGAAQTTRRRR